MVAVARDARGAAYLGGAGLPRPGGFELITCGGFFDWVRHPFDRATDDVVRVLAREHGMLAIPGTAFEPEDRGTLRFGVCTLDDTRLRDLVARLGSAGVAAADGHSGTGASRGSD